jgi:ABC-2 type transport system ATP-binding protein
MDDAAILVEGLTKHYRGPFWRQRPVPALDHLNLAVPRGMVFGFLGPNGAGKTTTIRCLMDLIRPTAGHAWVLGEPCGDVAVRARIGYLPDNPAFSPHLTAYQFLSLCGKLLRLPPDLRRTRIQEVLEAVGMTEKAHQAIRGYSRGMVQRVGIAQALLNHPELLVLDEPLVGLDPHGRKDLLEIVRQQRSKGTCVFFCSHILSDVEKLCDRVGILRKGQLLATGSLDELLGGKGTELVLPPGHDALARELLLEAEESHHDATGSWRLAFGAAMPPERLRERQLPEGAIVRTRRESLEELFFRLTKEGGDE